MPGKLMLAGILLLAGILGFQLFAMYTDLSREKTIKRKPVGYVFNKVERSAGAGSKDLGGIFHTIRKASDEEKESMEGNNKGDGLNQLILGDASIRVRGIFISREHRYGVISVVPRKKKNRKENKGDVVQVTVGEKIGGVTVVSIDPDSIGFKHPKEGVIYLRIFKHEKS